MEAFWPGFAGRNCTLVKHVVGKRDGEQVTFGLRDDCKGCSGLVGNRFDNTADEVLGGKGGARYSRFKTFFTKSFENVLREANAPRTIEYLSLDIEGAEQYVMEDFPFDRYTFLSMTVERPRHLRPLLEAKGYVYVRDNGAYGDELYIHQSIPNFESIMAELHVPKPLLASLLAWPWPRKELSGSNQGGGGESAGQQDGRNDAADLRHLYEEVARFKEELLLLQHENPSCWFSDVAIE